MDAVLIPWGGGGLTCGIASARELDTHKLFATQTPTNSHKLVGRSNRPENPTRTNASVGAIDQRIRSRSLKAV